MRNVLLSLLLVIAILAAVTLIFGWRANHRRAAVLRKQVTDSQRSLASPRPALGGGGDRYFDENVPASSVPDYLERRADATADAGLANAVTIRNAQLSAEAADYESRVLPPADDVGETIDALYWTIGALAVVFAGLLIRALTRRRRSPAAAKAAAG